MRIQTGIRNLHSCGKHKQQAKNKSIGQKITNYRKKGKNQNNNNKKLQIML
jgi:hypothetical protein